MKRPTKAQRIAKARQILQVLSERITALEDKAVEVWSREDSPAADHLAELLAERYTCRQVLESWLKRHAHSKCVRCGSVLHTLTECGVSRRREQS